MEAWLIYALITTILGGVITFGLKVAAQHHFESRIVMAFLNLTLGVLSLIAWLALGQPSTEFWLIVAMGVASGFANAFSNIFKVLSLKDIDTAIFFPIYKTLGPIVVTVIGISFFKEVFTTFEMIGIVVGIVVPLMLIHKAEKDRQGNLWRGLWLLVTAIFFSTIAVVVTKVGADSSASLWLFMTTMGFSGFVFSAGSYLPKNSLRNLSPRDLHLQKTVALGVGLGLVELALTFSYIKALEGGLLAVVFTINSFYILIPIILSVWLYNEHMNLRKGIAIGLSILAIVFFGL